MMSEGILSKYKFLEQIGSGSFGKVYKGIQINTKSMVAIKVFNEMTKGCDFK
jgi:serine/threonine protein kinase